MKYESLYNNFIALFPDDTDFFTNMELETGTDQSDGIHVLFGMVVVPFIVHCLKNNEVDKLKCAFSFFEEMAVSENTLISEVLEFTILEDILSRGGNFTNACKQFMGDKTISSLMHISRYLL